MLRTLLALSITIYFSANSFAQSSNFYCEERDLGGQFYCEIPLEEEVELVPPPPDSTPSEIEEFNKFKKALDDARALAVFTGEREHVEAYMVLQKQAGEMSSRFMEEYQVIGWQNPSLSYASAVPVNTGAKRVYRAERRQEVERHNRKIKHEYGVYYFYSKSCPACRQFSPVVKMLSARYGLTVIPIAKRGQESEEWPGTLVENGIGERLGLYGDVTPALVLFNAKEETGVPISYGVVALEDLENRIYMLTREDKVKFLGGSDDVR